MFQGSGCWLLTILLLVVGRTSEVESRHERGTEFPTLALVLNPARTENGPETGQKRGCVAVEHLKKNYYSELWSTILKLRTTFFPLYTTNGSVLQFPWKFIIYRWKIYAINRSLPGVLKRHPPPVKLMNNFMGILLSTFLSGCCLCL